MPAKRTAKVPKMDWVPESPLPRVLGRSMYDMEFRKRLKANPRKTLENELGIMLPDDMQVDVVENTHNLYTLVLPQPAEPEQRSLKKPMLGGFVYHIPEWNWVAALRLDDVKKSKGKRGFGKNPYPKTASKKG